MWKVFAWAFSWLTSAVVVKSVVMAGVFALVSFFVPFVVSKIVAFINPSLLTSAFAAIPPGVWWFLDAFALNLGLPLLFSAFVARFVIRRLPVIG